MYGAYVYTFSVVPTNLIVTLTNLSAGVYDLYLYGHGSQNDEYSVFGLTAGATTYPLESTINGAGWLSTNWQEGIQYVEFTNVSVGAGQAVMIVADYLSGLQMASSGPPQPEAPFIASQPASEAVPPGGAASLNVLAGGTPPLAYQ